MPNVLVGDLDGGSGAPKPSIENCVQLTLAREKERFDPREFDEPDDSNDRALLDPADGVGDGGLCGSTTVVPPPPRQSDVALVRLCCGAAVPACAKIRPIGLCAHAHALRFPLCTCQKRIGSDP